jgi:hypothetical protein
MKKITCKTNTWVAIILGALLLAGMGTNLSAAQRAKASPKSAQETVLEQQELVIRECKLNDEQQKTIKEKFKLKLEALETWEKANAEKVKAAEEAAKTARQGSDASAKKKAAGDLKELEANRNQATAETDKAILEVLSDEQKLIWAGVELAQATLPRYKKANLTDEQTVKIKAACLVAAKDLAACTGDDKKAKQGKTTVQKSLIWAIDNVILTAEQRETVSRKPARK